MRERETRRDGDTLARAALALLCGALAWLLVDRFAVWKLRFHGTRVARRLPNAVLPTPFTVLPPPEREYAGVWELPPEEARATLTEEYGFKQMIRAYLHAYERDGEMRYEAASCAYRPNGFAGAWQLHVRLFPTADGRTDVWCHWERNPNVAPIAHLRQDGYDPETGKERLRELLGPDALDP